MNEVPPTCFLGCCNVRSWTLVVAIINIVLITLQLIGHIASLPVSPEGSIINIIIDIIFLYINIKLRLAVLKHKIATVRLWLWIYSVLIILSVLLTIVSILIIAFIDFHEHTEYQELKENLLTIVIVCVIFEGFLVIWHYPVYQFYKFHKKSHSQQTVTPEFQTV